ncbi:MAG: energy transducer TonB [Proteobacteria bacterium]|nr:energy transducer TonB [Pseudomonadota bacterium]MBU1641543.1 energy transducer TonB [Pseudomonadota bacterium]
MVHPADPAHYFEILVRRNSMTWVYATLGAIGLNLLLFALLPHLQHPNREKPAFDEIAAQVNVIRLKPQETPVKRRIDKAPEPEKPKEQKLQPRANQPRALKSAMTLAFDLNPRLPSGPNSLALPPLDMVAFAPVGFDDAFSVGDLDGPLTTLVRIPPIYPMHAKHRGIEGWVKVRFVINEDGSVGGVTVLESSPAEIFDQSVIRCVSGWRFQAGTVGGIPVKAWAETTVRFELE